MTSATATYTDEQVSLIKRTICKGASDDELALFLHQCKRTGLDPFSRQIHAVKRWDGQQKREVLAIQTGIDGYRLIADRTGLYAGSDEADYGPASEAEKGVFAPEWARATVYKLVSGQRCAFSFRALWREFVQRTKEGRLTRFWREKPYLMLAKCAESQALRKAFPQELSGLYTDAEMPEEAPEPEAFEPEAFVDRMEKAQTLDELKAIGRHLSAAASSLTGDAVDRMRKEYVRALERLKTAGKRLPARPDGNAKKTRLAQLQAQIRTLAGALDPPLDDDALRRIAGEFEYDFDHLSEEGAGALLQELEQRKSEEVDREHR